MASLILKLLSAAVLVALSACSQPKAKVVKVSTSCGQYDRGKIQALRFWGVVKAEDRTWWRMTDCLHHNADVLAGGSDGADSIAKGVLDICTSEINAAVAAQRPPADPSSNLSVEEEGMRRYDQGQVRIAVLQDRAAHCPPPPISN